MNPINFERLEKLAAFLQVLPSEKWDFSEIVKEEDENGCGTVCCAMGWTPKVFPELAQWTCGGVTNRRLEFDLAGLAKEIFGIDENRYYSLFEPASLSCPLKHEATAKQVAAHIRKFIAENQ